MSLIQIQEDLSLIKVALVQLSRNQLVLASLIKSHTLASQLVIHASIDYGNKKVKHNDNNENNGSQQLPFMKYLV